MAGNSFMGKEFSRNEWSGRVVIASRHLCKASFSERDETLDGWQQKKVVDGWQKNCRFFRPDVVSLGKTLHTKHPVTLVTQLKLWAQIWLVTRSQSSNSWRCSDGISLGKVFHTHFPVLSETDVKLGGPPGVKQRCLFQKYCIAPMWLHVSSICYVYVVNQVIIIYCKALRAWCPPWISAI